MDTWMIDFMVFKKELTFKGRKISAAFNIMDLYSNLLISYFDPPLSEVERWVFKKRKQLVFNSFCLLITFPF
jgi:hypothetical protein